MTDSEKEDLKVKIKKVMEDHLVPLGYPDCDPDVIMRELKPMWIKLEEANLIVDGMSFEGYVDQANGAYMMNHMRTILGI